MVRTEADQLKERFSDAYLQAVVAVAGCYCYKPPDVDKIDWTIGMPGGQGTLRSPRVEVQLKCTKHDTPEGDLPYPLDVEAYESLRDPAVMVPRILVVVFVPEDVQDWVHQTEEQLALRRCAYWVSLRDLPGKDNEYTVTVRLPRPQVFSVPALRQILDNISNRGLP